MRHKLPETLASLGAGSALRGYERYAAVPVISMVTGIRFEVNGELYVEMDISKHIKIEVRVANVNLPEKIEPVTIGNQPLR